MTDLADHDLSKLSGRFSLTGLSTVVLFICAAWVAWVADPNGRAVRAARYLAGVQLDDLAEGVGLVRAAVDAGEVKAPPATLAVQLVEPSSDRAMAGALADAVREHANFDLDSASAHTLTFERASGAYSLAVRAKLWRHR